MKSSRVIRVLVSPGVPVPSVFVGGADIESVNMVQFTSSPAFKGLVVDVSFTGVSPVAGLWYFCLGIPVSAVNPFGNRHWQVWQISSFADNADGIVAISSPIRTLL